jgi:TPR repeat protein
MGLFELAKLEYELGEYFFDVKKDEKEGIKWFMKSARKGHKIAQNALGGYYFDGRGVKKDLKEGFKWFVKAAGDDTSFWKQITKIGGKRISRRPI